MSSILRVLIKECSPKKVFHVALLTLFTQQSHGVPKDALTSNPAFPMDVGPRDVARDRGCGARFEFELADHSHWWRTPSLCSRDRRHHQWVA